MSQPPKNLAPAAVPANRSWRAALAAAAAVALASVVPYVPVMSGGFVQDDHSIVESNPVVRQGDLAQIFGTDYWSGGAPGGASGLYRPVTILTFAMQRGPDGAVDPRAAHRVNIALHALASLALLLLARRCGATWPAAGAAGTLFAVHPVHAGAVGGIVGRAEVLAALFAMATLLAYTAAGPWGARRAPRFVAAAAWLSAAFVFLALASKETAIAAPFLMIALDLIFRPPERDRAWTWLRGRAVALAPMALAALAFVALRARVLGGALAVQKPVMSDNPLVAIEGAERIGTALGLAARAAGLLFLPLRLTPDYSGTVIPREAGILRPLPLAGAAFLVCLSALALAPWWIRALRGRPPSRVAPTLRRCAFAAALLLLPYLVIGNLLVPIGVIFAERLLYLPSAGFCLLLPCVAEAALASRRLSEPFRRALAAGLAALLVLAAAAGAVRTARASGDWTSDERLWESAVRSTPESPRAQFTLGKIRADQGRDAEAYELFDRATSLWPYFSSAWYEKGRILLARGDLEMAEEAFRRAAEQNPRHEGAAVGLGTALGRLGRRDDAVRSLAEAFSRLPRSAAVAEALGDALVEAGRFREAAEAYRRGAALGRPDLAERARDARSRASL